MSCQKSTSLGRKVHLSRTLPSCLLTQLINYPNNPTEDKYQRHGNTSQPSRLSKFKSRCRCAWKLVSRAFVYKPGMISANKQTKVLTSKVDSTIRVSPSSGKTILSSQVFLLASSIQFPYHCVPPAFWPKLCNILSLPTPIDTKGNWISRPLQKFTILVQIYDKLICINCSAEFSALLQISKSDPIRF